MKEIDYLAPSSLGEAYAALSNGKTSAFLAGGTDIIVQLREGRKQVDQLIDVKHIPELVSYGWTGAGGLEIGASVPFAEIYEDAEIVRRLPCVIDCATLIGGIQIQSRACFGGNIGNSGPAADTVPALIALGATLTLGSADGTRELVLEDFFTGPGQNVLGPGELIVKVNIPPQPANSGSFFHRFIPRNEMDIAVVNVGARLDLDAAGERIEGARISIGAVAPVPLFVAAAGEALVGQVAGDEAFAQAADIAADAATPITDMRGSIAQRVHLTRVLTNRALNRALDRAREA